MNNGQLSEQLNRWVWIDSWFPGGGAGNRLADADPTKPVYVRITRKGKSSPCRIASTARNGRCRKGTEV